MNADRGRPPSTALHSIYPYIQSIYLLENHRILVVGVLVSSSDNANTLTHDEIKCWNTLFKNEIIALMLNRQINIKSNHPTSF